MKMVTLGSIARFINGMAFKPSDWEDKGLPIIRIQNLTGSTNVVNYYSGGFDSKYYVKDGDILISWSATLGVYIWDGGDAVLNQHIFRVEFKDISVDRKFFYYAASNAIDEMQSNVHGTTMQHITRDRFLSIKIPLPPLSEQERIAAILDKADRLLHLRRFALELGDGYLQSVFLEMFGDLLHKPIKTKFEFVLARPLTNGLFEKNDKYGSGTPVVWVDNLYHTISIETEFLRRAQLDEKSIAKYEVFEGDLLFTRSSLVRGGIGQINIVPELDERTTFESHVIRARVNKSKVNPYYILGLYRTPFAKHELLKRSKTATMTTIGQDGISDLPCPIPPLPIQEKFAQVVHCYECLRSQQREALRLAEHLFQSLLARTFEGTRYEE